MSFSKFPFSFYHTVLGIINTLCNFEKSSNTKTAVNCQKSLFAFETLIFFYFRKFPHTPVSSPSPSSFGCRHCFSTPPHPILRLRSLVLGVAASLPCQYTHFQLICGLFKPLSTINWVYMIHKPVSTPKIRGETQR